MRWSAVLGVSEFPAIGIQEFESEATIGASEQRPLLFALLAGHEEITLKMPVVIEPSGKSDGNTYTHPRHCVSSGLMTV